MKVHADLGTMEKGVSVLRESGFEIERIRLEAEKELTALMQSWQGEDSQALKESFYAAGGLNEFSKRLSEGLLDFYRHLLDAKESYEKLADSIAQSECEASQKTGFI